MKNTRVLSRIGARELTPKEMENVSGGIRQIRTQTACTVALTTSNLDGDVGEC